MGGAESRDPMMTRVCWRLVDILSRMLDADERQTVSRALWDVLGLVVRRQAALWKDWRPWLVLVGLIGPVSILLSLSCSWINRSYDLNLWIIRNRRDIDPIILSQTGLSVRHGIALLARSSLLLFCWSWACGFVLGAMSRPVLFGSMGSCSVLRCLFSGISAQPPVSGWRLSI